MWLSQRCWTGWCVDESIPVCRQTLQSPVHGPSKHSLILTVSQHHHKQSSFSSCTHQLQPDQQQSKDSSPGWPTSCTGVARNFSPGRGSKTYCVLFATTKAGNSCNLGDRYPILQYFLIWFAKFSLVTRVVAREGSDRWMVDPPSQLHLHCRAGS